MSAKAVDPVWLDAMLKLLLITKHPASCAAFMLQGHRTIDPIEDNCNCAIATARKLIAKGGA